MTSQEKILKHLAEIHTRNEPAVLCTVISSQGSTPRHIGSKMLVFEDGHFVGSVGGGELENRVLAEAKATLIDGKGRILKYNMVDPARGDPGVCGGTVEVFLDPILPPPMLVVIGGGHVGKAVAHIAKWIGFHVVVSDDRAEFCTPEQNPNADAFYPVSMQELPTKLNITRSTYLVLATRGSSVDVPGLPTLLKTPAAYIGIIGSRRRWMETIKGLKEKGVADEQIARVHSPIGLELNAETPEEIAVSIMAEIIMLRNGGSGKTMRME